MKLLVDRTSLVLASLETLRVTVIYVLNLNLWITGFLGVNVVLSKEMHLLLQVDSRLKKLNVDSR